MTTPTMASEKRKEAQRLASARYRANNREIVNAKCRQRAAEKRAAYASDPGAHQAIGAELQARREASARYYAKNAEKIRARSRERLRNQRAKANLARLEKVKAWADGGPETKEGAGHHKVEASSPTLSSSVDWDHEHFLSSSEEGSLRSPHAHSRSLSSISPVLVGRELSPSLLIPSTSAPSSSLNDFRLNAPTPMHRPLLHLPSDPRPNVSSPLHNSRGPPMPLASSSHPRSGTPAALYRASSTHSPPNDGPQDPRPSLRHKKHLFVD